MRSLNLHGAEKVVCIEFGGAIIMNSIKRKRFLFQVSHSGHVRKLVLNWPLCFLRFIASSGTEVGGLIHVLPESIKWYDLIKLIKPTLPVYFSVFLEKIREYCISWPNLPSQYLSRICLSFNENILINPIFISFIASSLGNSSIKNRNIVKPLFLEALNRICDISKRSLVNCKISVVIQVVNI